MQYPLALAIEDFVPVIFGGVGFYLVAKLWAGHSEQTRRLGAIGALLIFLGGLSKASWKLLHSISEGALDVELLNRALFFCLGPGFVFLAFAVLCSGESKSGRKWWSKPWSGALITTGLTLAVSTGLFFSVPGRAYEFAMLGTAVLASNIVLVMCIRWAWRSGLVLSALLYTGYLITTYVLPILMASEQSVALQWAEQALNTVATFGLCIAGVLLIRHRRDAPGASSSSRRTRPAPEDHATAA